MGMTATLLRCGVVMCVLLAVCDASSAPSKRTDGSLKTSQHSKCCHTFALTGLENTIQSIRMGEYSTDGNKIGDKPLYKKKGSEEYVFHFNHDRWLVGPAPGVNDAGIIISNSNFCPAKLTETFSIDVSWYDGTRFQKGQMRMSCLTDEAEKGEVVSDSMSYSDFIRAIDPQQKGVVTADQLSSILGITLEQAQSILETKGLDLDNDGKITPLELAVFWDKDKSGTLSIRELASGISTNAHSMEKARNFVRKSKRVAVEKDLPVDSGSGVEKNVRNARKAVLDEMVQKRLDVMKKDGKVDESRAQKHKTVTSDEPKPLVSASQLNDQFKKLRKVNPDTSGTVEKDTKAGQKAPFVTPEDLKERIEKLRKHKDTTTDEVSRTVEKGKSKHNSSDSRFLISASDLQNQHEKLRKPKSERSGPVEKDTKAGQKAPFVTPEDLKERIQKLRKPNEAVEKDTKAGKKSPLITPDQLNDQIAKLRKPKDTTAKSVSRTVENVSKAEKKKPFVTPEMIKGQIEKLRAPKQEPSGTIQKDAMKTKPRFSASQQEIRDQLAKLRKVEKNPNQEPSGTIEKPKRPPGAVNQPFVATEKEVREKLATLRKVDKQAVKPPVERSGPPNVLDDLNTREVSKGKLRKYMDVNGNGVINFEQFHQLVRIPLRSDSYSIFNHFADLHKPKSKELNVAWFVDQFASKNDKISIEELASQLYASKLSNAVLLAKRINSAQASFVKPQTEHSKNPSKSKSEHSKSITKKHKKNPEPSKAHSPDTTTDTTIEHSTFIGPLNQGKAEIVTVDQLRPVFDVLNSDGKVDKSELVAVLGISKEKAAKILTVANAESDHSISLTSLARALDPERDGIVHLRVIRNVFGMTRNQANEWAQSVNQKVDSRSIVPKTDLPRLYEFLREGSPTFSKKEFDQLHKEIQKLSGICHFSTAKYDDNSRQQLFSLLDPRGINTVSADLLAQVLLGSFDRRSDAIKIINAANSIPHKNLFQTPEQVAFQNVKTETEAPKARESSSGDEGLFGDIFEDSNNKPKVKDDGDSDIEDPEELFEASENSKKKAKKPLKEKPESSVDPLESDPEIGNKALDRLPAETLNTGDPDDEEVDRSGNVEKVLVQETNPIAEVEDGVESSGIESVNAPFKAEAVTELSISYFTSFIAQSQHLSEECTIEQLQEALDISYINLQTILDEWQITPTRGSIGFQKLLLHIKDPKTHHIPLESISRVFYKSDIEKARDFASRVIRYMGEQSISTTECAGMFDVHKTGELTRDDLSKLLHLSGHNLYLIEEITKALGGTPFPVSRLVKFLEYRDSGKVRMFEFMSRLFGQKLHEHASLQMSFERVRGLLKQRWKKV